MVRTPFPHSQGLPHPYLVDHQPSDIQDAAAAVVGVGDDGAERAEVRCRNLSQIVAGLVSQPRQPRREERRCRRL